MDLLTAVDQLAALPDAELDALLPDDAMARCVQAGVGRGIVVLSFLVGGISLSGQLDDCRDTNNLREAFRHFRSLWDSDVFTDEQWSDAATDVFQEIEQDAMRIAMQIGESIESKRRQFTRAELN